MHGQLLEKSQIPKNTVNINTSYLILALIAVLSSLAIFITSRINARRRARRQSPTAPTPVPAAPTPQPVAVVSTTQVGPTAPVVPTQSQPLWNPPEKRYGGIIVGVIFTMMLAMIVATSIKIGNGRKEEAEVLTIFLLVLSGLAYFDALKSHVFLLSPRSGELYTVTRLSTSHRHIFDTPGKHLNDPASKNFDPTQQRWEVLANMPNHHEERNWHEKLGIYVIAFPFERVKKKWMSWAEMFQPPSTAGNPNIDYVRWSRAEFVESLYEKSFQYFGTIKGVLLKGNITYDVEYLLNVRTTNPEIAQWKVDDFVAKALALAEEAGKNYLGSDTIESFISETDKIGTKHGFKQAMLALNHQYDTDGNLVALNGGLPMTAGITIEDGDLLRITQQKLTDTTPAGLAQTAVFVAEREAEAALIRKKKEAEGILAMGEAQALVITKKGDAAAKIIGGPGGKAALGASFAIAEAIEKHKGTLILGPGVLPTINVNDQP